MQRYIYFTLVAVAAQWILNSYLLYSLSSRMFQEEQTYVAFTENFLYPQPKPNEGDDIFSKLTSSFCMV